MIAKYGFNKKKHAYTCKCCGNHTVNWKNDVTKCASCGNVIKDERESQNKTVEN